MDDKAREKIAQIAQHALACGNDGKPVSDGPFSLTNYTKGQGSTLRKNALFYGKKAKLNEIDFSEFLASRQLAAPLGAVRTRAVYVDSCHLRHVQKVARAPRDLLGAVPGLELVELAHPDWCCGSAGTYNIEKPEMSDRVLARKLENIRGSGADYLVTANPGCLLQLKKGLNEHLPGVRVIHLTELLLMSMQQT